jgi:tRNA nucleotidyltransferase (CCA-adding enzyme)
MTCSLESKPNMPDVPPAHPALDIYRVGGTLRDEWLGRSHADQDFVVLNASEQDFCRAFPEAKKVGGQRGAVYYVNGAEFTLSQAGDIHADLARRDLTINALAQDKNGRLFALERSWSDLRSKVLRQVDDANFFHDPLRVFRAARLAAQLPEFTLAGELEELLTRVGRSGTLKRLSPERVGQETLKACEASRPGRFLRILSRTSTLPPWLTEMARADVIPAGPPEAHDGSLLEHTARVMDLLAGNPLQVWMGLCHDLGKALTPESEWPHHHGHEHRGSGAASSLARRLRLPKAFLLAGHRAARWHMTAGSYDRLRPGTRVDLLTSLQSERNVRDLFSLVKADQGQDHLARAMADFRIIRTVKLKPEHRNQGEVSGRILREQQALALAQSSFARGKA